MACALRCATNVVVDGFLPTAPTPGLQPSMVPFSVSKMNSDAPVWPRLSLTMKACGNGLNTCPVGAMPRTLTTRPTLATEAGPVPAYSVALSVPLSATHSGEPGLASVPGEAARPQALTRSVSRSGARMCWSETRLTCR